MVLAQGLTKQSATAKHTVGQIYDDVGTGARYVYCVDSGSGNSAYNPVYITPSTFVTAALTKAAADKGYKVGIPQIAVTASYYYWAMIRSGSSTAYVLTKSACASEATLFTTSTAGCLDDLPTSQTGIGGVRLTATAATAAASAVAACTIDDPEPFSVETAFDVAESMADSAALIAASAQSSAMSAMSSAVSAGAYAALASSSAMSSAVSAGAYAALASSSAMSSAVSAANIAITVSVAQSAYVQHIDTDSAAAAVSYAKAANTAAGNFISALVSEVSSAVGKTV